MSQFRLDPAARYARSHEWVRLEDGLAVVGISDAAQDMLSDIVYIELPEVGAQVSAGKQAAVVESVKAAEEVLSPVSGTVIEVNGDLTATPELANSNPYEAWFFKVQPGDGVEAELGALLGMDAYDEFVDSSAH